MSDLEISSLIKDLSDNYANNHISLSEYRYQRRILLQQVDCEFNQLCVDDVLQTNEEASSFQENNDIANNQHADISEILTETPEAEEADEEAFVEDIRSITNRQYFRSTVTDVDTEIQQEVKEYSEDEIALHIEELGSITNHQYIEPVADSSNVSEQDNDKQSVLENIYEEEQ